MTQRLHVYEGGGVTVTFDKARCIHSAHCVRNLPAVFNTAARPWVQPDKADPATVLAIVAGCPTGALHATRDDGSTADALVSSDITSIHVMPNGPVFVRGNVTLVTGDDLALGSDTRMALCRCGHSANKPFCDNSHRTTGWRDERSAS